MQEGLNRLSRSMLLLGEEAIQRLQNARVAVFGLGGVGSYTVEALARGGIGHLTLIDIVFSSLNKKVRSRSYAPKNA